jgi:hypothetical protein
LERRTVLYERLVSVPGELPKGLTRRAAPRAGRTIAAVVLAALFFGCGKPARRARDGDTQRAGARVCKANEVREYSCEALLPVESARPAPDPYGTCPSSIEVRDAHFPPRSGTGDFDPARTEFVRHRSPPGQQCCYSWCGKLEVVSPEVVEDRCREPLAFAESYCTAELESGTEGDLAPSPFDRCAAAIRPPAAAAFSVPPGANLDPALSTTRRKRGEDLCCYSWCSVSPPGTSLR